MDSGPDAPKLSFISAIADICELVGAEVRHVMNGVGCNHRIGPAFRMPARPLEAPVFPRTPNHSPGSYCRAAAPSGDLEAEYPVGAVADADCAG